MIIKDFTYMAYKGAGRIQVQAPPPPEIPPKRQSLSNDMSGAEPQHKAGLNPINAYNLLLFR